MNIRKILYITLPFFLVLLPIAIGWGLQVYIPIGDFTLGVYFIVLSIYLIIQYTSAIINRRNVNKLPKGDHSQKVSILVVGYKENKDYFKACIESLNCLVYPNIEQIIFVCDDNSHESQYMHDIFNNTLKHSMVSSISLGIPHSGKRHAMDRGFQELLFDNSNFILTIDSDTILDPNCLNHLVNKITNDPTLGAVTGHLRIFNDTSVISFISRLRYFFAFNIERSAQSLYGSVNCVSGPLGLYKKEIIRDSRKEWLKQTFMKQECSYGDDRHLTYQVLSNGHKVGYTHLAEAQTESPETLSRWFTQQTRWNKSSIRETKWTLESLHNQHFWMTIELVYTFCYHFIILFSLLYIIFFTNSLYVAIWFLVTFVLAFIKGIIASIIDKSPIYLLFPLYNLLFTFLFIPSKIYALFTLRDIKWGTSSRKIITGNISQLYPAFLWITFIIIGILYNFVLLSKWTIINISLCISVPFLYTTLFILAKIYCVYFFKGLDKVYSHYNIH